MGITMHSGHLIIKNTKDEIIISFRLLLTFVFFLYFLNIGGEANAKDWKKSISEFKIAKFSIALKDVELLSPEEARKKIYNDYLLYINNLSTDYKTTIGVDYSPFMASHQLEMIREVIAKLQEINLNSINEIQDKVNSNVRYDFYYLKEYDFGLSMHQLYDLKITIENQKEINSNLNKEILNLKKEQNKIKRYALVALVALVLSFLIRKTKSKPS